MIYKIGHGSARWRVSREYVIYVFKYIQYLYSNMYHTYVQICLIYIIRHWQRKMTHELIECCRCFTPPPRPSFFHTYIHIMWIYDIYIQIRMICIFKDIWICIFRHWQRGMMHEPIKCCGCFRSPPPVLKRIQELRENVMSYIQICMMKQQHLLKTYITYNFRHWQRGMTRDPIKCCRCFWNKFTCVKKIHVYVWKMLLKCMWMCEWCRKEGRGAPPP